MSSAKTIRHLVYAIKIGLFILPLLSLIVLDFLFFPFITGKNFFFRIIVEILFFLWVVVMVFDKKYRPKISPLFIAISATLGILVLATIFGENPYKSFWSNFERMEGLLTHIHLFLYFLILTSVFKTKKDWKLFFAVMLFVSLIVSGYGFLQYLGKLAIHQSNVRLDATLGNATYLAIFLIFHLFLIVLFVFWFRNFWLRIGLGLLFVFETFVMFLTATRGAILGFLAGLFLFALLMVVFSKKKSLRYGFLGIIVFLSLLVGSFFLFKDSGFIRKNHVFSRFATISLADATTESRFIIWGMSFEGFKEHPFLGWGSGNYNLVFNKYYKSKLWRQEPWFDRAHNIIFDWLISAGILGLLAYISIFITALYIMWRGYRKRCVALFESVAVTSVFAAYSFHNLFVFDNITSYFMFFSVLGFVQFVWPFAKGVEKSGSELELAASKGAQKEIGGFGYLSITLAFVLLVFSLYFVNLKPLMAANRLLDSLYLMKAGQPPDKVLESFDSIFALDTFGSGEAREQLSAYANQLVSSNSVSPDKKLEVLNKAIEEMEKQKKLTQNKDIRYLIMLSSLYNNKGDHDKALETVNRAIELSPNKQDIYFLKADIFLSKGDLGGAIKIMEKNYSLDPSYPAVSKSLAALYISSGKVEKGEGLLKKHFGKILMADKQLLNAYAKAEDYEKVRDIWLLFLKKEPNNIQYHFGLSATYLKLGKREKAIAELEKVAELDPKFKNQSQQIIEKIKKGEL
jgi:O-antigen ligase/tetratricopeptide (TPR) repeat protein